MILSDFSIKTASQLATNYFEIDVRQAKTLAGDIDKNYYIRDFDGKEYILKIANPISDFASLEMQTQMMQHLAEQSLELKLPNVLTNKNGEFITILQDEEGQNRFVRLLTWVKGRMWSNVNPITNELLYSLGETAGELTKSLKGFEHPAAHRRAFRWDNCNLDWAKSHLQYVESDEQKELIQYFIELFEEQAKPHLAELRHGVIQGDLNDNNLIVSSDLAHPKVEGLIDFGDSIYLPVINELAIALAYAIMHKPDPLAAARPVIKGFRQKYPLQEKEIAVLFPLITNRLLISVVNSSFNKVNEPENEYLLISAKPAWELLEKLRAISPQLAHYHFRFACAWDAVPKHSKIVNYLKNNQNEFAPIIDYDLKNQSFKLLDLSVGSLELGNNSDYEKVDNFHQKVLQLLAEENTAFGIGKYNEVRPIYTTDRYLVQGNEGSQWRTVHLGLDVFGEAGTTVFAPLDGVVHSFQNNAYDLDYGPTIILEHEISSDEKFYTLYGHLNVECLEDLSVGKVIQKGQAIAKFGNRHVNGGWSPHLHFQIILDMLGKEGDFHGVAFPNERELWTNLCPDPNLILGLDLEEKKEALSSQKIIQSRKKHLGRSLSLSYSKPLHMVRGYKQYLYAADGRRYLDTVNNVPHVGHQHPKVVRAAQRQMALLNTNTRYLHEEIVQFAEELSATLPPELSVCHFVNSGSEANELAIRMARAFSGQKDLLVSEVGYHGNTNACVNVSSYKFDGKGGQGAPDWVHVFPMPDGYRGSYKNSDADAGKKYAQHVLNLIQKVQNEGRNISGFLCESILSCGGQVVPPAGFFQEAYSMIRAAGGLCISDEVQVGFGRVGKQFWGFELHDVVPDIVVMGKPIGNGHPLGAVVCTEAVADAFNNGMEYFNTFGGNPVSCAIGRAVLQVIEEEGLQKNAFEVGEYLKTGLCQLQTQFPIIGDVRGEGFFLGFELIRNRETLEPADKETSYLANRMRQHGILNSTDGLHHNVIKIKPPMCFDKANADFLLTKFEEIFKEDFMQIKSSAKI